MTQANVHIFDVVVIGAGVSGCCTARELARYHLSCAVLDLGNDIACATSRANSGIVHSGYDPRPESLKAQYCVRGSRLFPQWAAELGFGYRNNGSLVVAFNEEEVAALAELERRGTANGVQGLRLVDAAELLSMEPRLSREACGALFAPSGAICDPYGLAFSAAENAAENGVRFLFNRRVVGVRRQECGGFEVKAAVGFGAEMPDGPEIKTKTETKTPSAGLEAKTTTKPEPESEAASVETLWCRTIVDAAGVHADEINNLVSDVRLSITAVRGEYLLYDTPWGDTFQHTMFQTPGPRGKGILVTPTIHGNLIIGPSAVPQQDKNDTSTTSEGMAYVLDTATKTWPEASAQGIIGNFAGLRAKGANRDFVVGEASDVPGFFNIACFESPGLTAAPAVAVDIAEQVAHRLDAERRSDFNPIRQRAAEKPFVAMDDSERVVAIARDPRYGRVICRCCNVTEAEVVRELEGVLPVFSLDALKWRTNATMGRCHGGFCVPELVRIITEHTGLLPEEIDKRLAGSRLLVKSSAEYERRRDARDGETRTGRREEGGRGKCPTNPSGTLAPSPRPPLSQPPAAFDVVVIGAGAAGLAAADAARREGARVALLDRQPFVGGILRQCIHSGFGLERFGAELTGPEYADREAEGLIETDVDVLLNTTVLSIGRTDPLSFVVHAADAAEGALSLGTGQAGQSSPFAVRAVNTTGVWELSCRAVVLATGSRERGQGALRLAGSRPAGVFSAGSAQDLINLKGCLTGRRVIIQGSGDIGLIMARRCVFAGAEVLGVLARSAKPSGLRRNVIQCLDDFGIPFLDGRVVTRLEGADRLEAVWVSRVDPQTKKVLLGTEQRVVCDTLLLSIGLLPENEVAQTVGVSLDPRGGGPVVDAYCATDVPGVYACGNSLHIHDLADHASIEGELAGTHAARFALSLGASGGELAGELADSRVGKDAPSSADAGDTSVSVTRAAVASVSNVAGSVKTAGVAAVATVAAVTEDDLLHLTCVRCPKSCDLAVTLNVDGTIADVQGNGCKLGLRYAEEEIAHPTRIVTAALDIRGSIEPLSVKTAAPVPREKVFEVLSAAYALDLKAPVDSGAVLLKNIAATGTDLVATKTLY